MVVCKVYKLFKDGKNFTKEGKKVTRNRCVIPRWYAEDKNAKWLQNGRWHEINEKATEEYYEVELAKKEQEREDEKEKGELKEILTGVIKEGVKTKAPKKAKAKKEDIVEVSQELLDLREEYVEVFGKKISGRYLNDAEWIAKKINESKAE